MSRSGKKQALARNRGGEIGPPGAPPTAQLPGVDLRELGEMLITSASFSGPCPPPAFLREYDQILPGAADRLFKMAESALAHGQAMDKATGRRVGIGQVFGFVIAMFGLSVSGFFAYEGHAVTGAALGGVDLVSLVGMFVVGRRMRQKQSESPHPPQGHPTQGLPPPPPPPGSAQEK